MEPDYVHRFVFEALDIRGRLVSLGPAWQRMLEGRAYPDEVATLLGHTTALAVLLGANRKDAARITLQVQGEGPVRLLIADCAAGLRIRGMAQYDAARCAGLDERALLGEGRMSLMLEEPGGRLYQSLVPLEGATLAEIFGHYLAQSEQRPALLRLFADDAAVGGLLLEQMPGAAQRDPDGWQRIGHLAATLAPQELRALRPNTLLTRVFPQELLRVFPLEPVAYHCPRDPERVADMLRRLGRAELESILREHGEVVIRNEMCNHVYRFGPAEVAALFPGGAAEGT